MPRRAQPVTPRRTQPSTRTRNTSTGSSRPFTRRGPIDSQATSGAAATVLAAATISPPFGLGLQPRRDVHGVAHHRVLEPPAAADRAGDHRAGVHADPHAHRRAGPRRPIPRRSAPLGGAASRSRSAARDRRDRRAAPARRTPPSRRRPGTCRSCRRARRRPRPSRSGADRPPPRRRAPRAVRRSSRTRGCRENRTVTSTSWGSIAVSGCAASRSASCCGTNDASVLRGLGLLDTAACSRLNSSTRLEPPLAVGHPAEQLGHLPVDGLLRRAERGRRSPRSRGPWPSCRAARGRARRRSLRPESRSAIEGSTVLPPACDLADRARELVALGDPVLQQVARARCGRGRAARSRTPRRRGRTAPRPRCPGAVSRIACAQSMPSSWKRRRHLDVGDDHVGHVLGRGGQQRGRVLGHARRPRCRRRSRAARERPRARARCPRRARP